MARPVLSKPLHSWSISWRCRRQKFLRQRSQVNGMTWHKHRPQWQTHTRVTQYRFTSQSTCCSACVKQSYLQSYLQQTDWSIEQGLMSHQTHYRSYRRRFLQVIWPNQQCQSSEGNWLVFQIRPESHQHYSTMLQ